MASLSFAILFFDVIISNNLDSSKTLIHLVVIAREQKRFIVKYKSWCKKKRLSLQIYYNVAYFTFIKFTEDQKKVFTLSFCDGKKSFGTQKSGAHHNAIN